MRDKSKETLHFLDTSQPKVSPNARGKKVRLVYNRSANGIKNVHQAHSNYTCALMTNRSSTETKSFTLEDGEDRNQPTRNPPLKCTLVLHHHLFYLLCHLFSYNSNIRFDIDAGHSPSKRHSMLSNISVNVAP